MTREEAVSAYIRGDISRRDFIAALCEDRRQVPGDAFATEPCPKCAALAEPPEKPLGRFWWRLVRWIRRLRNKRTSCVNITGCVRRMVVTRSLTADVRRSRAR